jgi:hypothetical protein
MCLVARGHPTTSGTANENAAAGISIHGVHRWCPVLIPHYAADEPVAVRHPV